MFERLLRSMSLTKKGFFRVLLGCAIMAFTVVNVHMPAKITEGGILGLTMFSYKVLGLDPAIVSPILDFGGLALGLSLFGKNFRRRTLTAALVFACFYKLFLAIGPILPELFPYPLLASLIGGTGIGIGCGLVVSQGGAAGGDDVLAFFLSKKLKLSLAKAYFLSDFVVLALSLAYIPLARIFFSFLTTVVSSALIGQFEIHFKKPAPTLTLAKSKI